MLKMLDSYRITESFGIIWCFVLCLSTMLGCNDYDYLAFLTFFFSNPVLAASLSFL